MGDFERRRGDLALGARARGDFERRGGMRASFLERAAAARSAACRRAAVSATAAAWARAAWAAVSRAAATAWLAAVRAFSASSKRFIVAVRGVTSEPVGRSAPDWSAVTTLGDGTGGGEERGLFPSTLRSTTRRRSTGCCSRC